jgi:hypothetical protein
MNKAVTDLKPESEVTPDPLALLRAPFPPNQISKLPKPYKKDSPKGKCAECGGYHGLPAVHLDYVGHAALTDRLLDTDPTWSWEPVADPASQGLPVAPGGMWIRLTVCGISRYGFGHPDGKTGGDAVKETIGDALRNAAMRFGAALDLWHKGDLHAHDDGEPEVDLAAKAEELAMNLLRGCGSKEMFADAWGKNKDGWKRALGNEAYVRLVAEMKRLAENFKEAAPPKATAPINTSFDISDDEIPY